ncbi:FecR family protein [Aquimarina sp. 2201CG1-2-11]|uniref:FecR family protein n=1 Tax=Aquimarina discodermiae TaxID=3231043 RepID=UPI0034624CE6
MKKHEDLEINRIHKYLNNEMSDQEVSEFETLLKDKNYLEKFKEYIITNHYIQMGNNDFDNEQAFSKFQVQIKKNTRSTRVRKNKTSSFLKYAAIFVGLLVAGTSTYVYLNSKDPNQNNNQITLQLDDESPEILKESEVFKEIKSKEGIILGIQENNKLVYDVNDSSKTPPKINTLTVPYGKKFKLVLADGTIVNVNSGTTLKFPSHFVPGQLREVELSGEAYFEVMRNEKDAFIVSTNGIKTEVFGTKFNVSSYANDSFSEVVLVEGSVGVFKEKSRFDPATDQKLKPQQKASHSKSKKEVQVSNVDSKNYIAWVDGVLLFKNEKFESIMKKLERFYDKKITINYHKIKDEKFTGQFDIENIEDVLNTFKSNTFFNVNIKGNEIIINP